MRCMALLAYVFKEASFAQQSEWTRALSNAGFAKITSAVNQRFYKLTLELNGEPNLDLRIST